MRRLTIVLPIVSSLYFVVAYLLGFLNDFVLGLLVIFITVLVVISETRKRAKDVGKLVVTDSHNGTVLFSLEMDEDPMDLLKMDTVSFKVEK